MVNGVNGVMGVSVGASGRSTASFRASATNFFVKMEGVMVVRLLIVMLKLLIGGGFKMLK